MAGENGAAGPLALKNGAVCLRLLAFQPTKQGRAEVSRDTLVVADDARNPAFVIEEPGRAVRGVAFAVYPLVPVMKGVGGVLFLDLFEPGMLAKRLVEVAVNADVPFDSLSLFLTCGQPLAGAVPSSAVRAD